MSVPLYRKIAARYLLSLTDVEECSITDRVASNVDSGLSEEDVFVHQYEDIMEAVLTDDEIISDVIEQMFETEVLTIEDDGGVYYGDRRIL